MNNRQIKFLDYSIGILLVALLMFIVVPLTKGEILKAGPITFDLLVVDKTFRGEGVWMADVDRDGLNDMLTGDFWYKAPDWERFEIREPGDWQPKEWSTIMNIYVGDWNEDGYPDQLIMPFPGKRVFWYENPKGGPGRWEKHDVGFSYANETPNFRPLFGKENIVVTPSVDNQRFAWWTPGDDPTAFWEEHTLSGGATDPRTSKYDHGIGTGDLDGDGRKDIFTPIGWWKHPFDPSKVWKYTPSNFGSSHSSNHSCEVQVYDVDGNGKNDLVMGNPHKYGVWWNQNLGNGKWQKNMIDKLPSQVHALHIGDMDNDGLTDIVTGKRRYAHNGSGIDGEGDALLIWYKLVRSDGKASFKKYVIKPKEAGVGTDFWIGDYNRDQFWDIVVSNKHGIQIYTQVPRPELNLKPLGPLPTIPPTNGTPVDLLSSLAEKRENRILMVEKWVYQNSRTQQIRDVLGRRVNGLAKIPSNINFSSK